MKKILIFFGLKIAEIIGAGIALFVLHLIISLIPPELISKLVEWMNSLFPDIELFLGGIIIMSIDFIFLIVLIVLWIRKNWGLAKLLNNRGK